MNQVLNANNNIIIGSEVLFFLDGFPHTGIVSKMYENFYEIADVTGISPYDGPGLLKEQMYSIEKEKLYKTSQVWIPKYPNEPQNVYISNIMHTASKDNKFEVIDVEKFLKNYKLKTLFSKDTSMTHPFPQNYIEFTNFTFIKFNHEELKKNVYRNIDITNPKHGFVCSVLEEYTVKNKVYPSKIIYPSWIDKERSNPVIGIHLIGVINKYYTTRYRELIDIDEIDESTFTVHSMNINEYDIDRVYEWNKHSAKEMIQAEIDEDMTAEEIGNLIFREEGDSLEISNRYMDLVYKSI